MTLPADVNEEQMGGKTRSIQGKSDLFVLLFIYYYYFISIFILFKLFSLK